MRFQSGVRRSCHRLTLGSGERPCSTKRKRPSGLSTRRISFSAPMTSGIEHSVHVVTTVSSAGRTLRQWHHSVDPLGACNRRRSRWAKLLVDLGRPATLHPKPDLQRLGFRDLGDARQTHRLRGLGKDCTRERCRVTGSHRRTQCRQGSGERRLGRPASGLIREGNVSVQAYSTHTAVTHSALLLRAERVLDLLAD